MKVIMFKLLLFITLIFSINLFSQSTNSDLLRSNDVEEGIFKISYESYLKADIPVFSIDTSTYIPIIQTFELLQINSYYDYQNQSIRGFFLNTDSTYEFDFKNKFMQYRNLRQSILEKEFLIGTTDIFVNPLLFERLFNIKISLKFSKLSLTVNSSRALPIKIEFDRKNKYEYLIDKNSEVKDQPLVFDRYRSIINGGVFAYKIMGHTTNKSNYLSSYGNIGMELFGGDFQEDYSL